MTTTAHGKRRIYSGATDEPLPRTSTPRRSFYSELHPEMFVDIPSSKIPRPQPVPKPPKPPPPRRLPEPLPPVKVSAKEKIILWLWDNGPATAPQIAAALGHKTADSVGFLLRGRIDGVGVVGQHLPNKGKPVNLWGIV